jgi:hypothetical protein
VERSTNYDQFAISDTVDPRAPSYCRGCSAGINSTNPASARSWPPRSCSIDYLERRIQEGKTRREAYAVVGEDAPSNMIANRDSWLRKSLPMPGLNEQIRLADLLEQVNVLNRLVAAAGEDAEALAPALLDAALASAEGRE